MNNPQDTIPRYRTIAEAWLNTCQSTMEFGRRYKIERGSYTGQQRAQLDRWAFVITNPGERPLSVEWPPGGLGHPISDEDSINRYFEDYLINTEVAENEQYTYGSRIGPWLKRVAGMLLSTPFTNQANISVARPEDILLDDPPCLRELSWKWNGVGLQLTSFWRSWDVYGALSINLGGLQLLNEAVAEWADLVPGSMFCVSDGGHIYEQSWKDAPARYWKVR